jgi:hypothetical protein
VLLSLLVLAASEQALPRDKHVEASVSAWQVDTKIEVSDYSATRLRNDIPSMAVQLGLMDPAAATIDDEYEAFVLDTLTQNFLYWSRDRDAVDAKRLGEPTVAPDRLQRFVASLQPLVAGRPVGRLEVTSNPTSGAIQIDGQDKGRTQSVFVLSAGSHSVVVAPPGKAPCSRTVVITRGQSSTVDCG